MIRVVDSGSLLKGKVVLYALYADSEDSADSIEHQHSFVSDKFCETIDCGQELTELMNLIRFHIIESAKEQGNKSVQTSQEKK